jgi:hypothetical protein
MLGMAAGVAAPALIDFARERDGAERTADELLALLRTARRATVAEGVATTLTVSPSDGRYWLTAADGTEIRSLSHGTLSLPPDVRILPGRARIQHRFRPAGGASGDPLVVVGTRSRVFIGVDIWTAEPYSRVAASTAEHPRGSER